MKYSLIWIAVAFITGIAAGGAINLPVSWGLALFGLASLLCLLLRLTCPRLVPALLLAAIGFWGAFWYTLSIFPAEKYQALAGEEVAGQGYILSYPKTGAYNISFIVRVEELTAKKGEINGLAKLLIKIPVTEETDFKPGDRVQFRGILSKPDRAGNPGQFDYRRYLANQQVFFQIRCQDYDCTLLSPGYGLRALAAKGRPRVANLMATTLPPAEKALLMGLLFGDTSGMDSEEATAYQRAGVSHLFAVSGFNVAFVLGILWFLLTIFRPGPWAKLVLAIPFLMGYYFLVGWSASIVRASLMAMLVLAAVAFGRKRDVYTALAGAALLILLISPGELFQTGFQLSFVTTGGLAYLTPWLQERGLGKYLAPAMAAQLCSMPLVAYYFNLLSLIAPFLNVLAALISGIVTVLGLVGAMLTWLLPFLAKPIFIFCGFLMFCLSRFIVWSANLPWAALIVPTPPLYALALCYLLLLALPVYRRWLPWLRSLCSPCWVPWAAGLGCLLLFLFCLPGQALLQVTFLDVGQGESIFIRTPGGQKILLDGGGSPEGNFAVGEKVVLPFLRHKGVRSLDAIIMSHNHIDHSEGLLEIIPQLPVKTCYMPPAEPGNPVDQALQQLCRERGISLLELTAGQQLLLEKGLVLEILHPPPGDRSRGNNHSLVLRLVYGDNEWLLTGDIENEGLAGLLQGNWELQADLLKLPHHGSISSYHEDFYRKVNPRAVVASAGDSSFNHPHPQVVEYFRKRAINVYSTKDNGAVVTTSDGKKLRIYPYIK